MTQELIKKEDINLAKNLSGESSGANIPFIPIITINNIKQKELVEINGEKKEVEIPPEKGFNLTDKIDGEIKTKFWRTELSAGILKVRYQINSRYKQTEQPFFSYEFDDFNSIIQVRSLYDKDHVIAEGTYRDIKQKFLSDQVDSMGNRKAIFRLTAVLYLDVDDKIYRFRWRMGKYNNLFDYMNSFGENDTMVAYKTNFVLHQEKSGDITFWYAQAERGERLNLQEQLQKQKELYNSLHVLNNILQQPSAISSEQIITPEDPTNVNIDEPPPISDQDIPQEDNILPEQIPF